MSLELGRKRAEELGLMWVNKDGSPMRFNQEPIFYHADYIHKLLGEADNLWIVNSYITDTRTAHLAQPVDSTHTALLIGIKPIVRDTAESLLREMLNFGSVDKSESFYERAKALLGEKP